MQSKTSQNLSKLILLCLSSLSASAFGMNHPATEKLAYWFEHNAIPESVESYASRFLHIDLKTDEGRQELLQLLARPQIEDKEELRLFESVETGMRTMSMDTLEGLVSTIMATEIV